MNDLPNIFNESHDPVEVGKYLSNVLVYADDLVLMSNSKAGLQKCLNELNIYCKTWRLMLIRKDTNNHL